MGSKNIKWWEGRRRENMHLAKYTRAKEIKYDDNNLLRVDLLLVIGRLEMILRTRHMVIHTAS